MLNEPPEQRTLIPSENLLTVTVQLSEHLPSAVLTVIVVSPFETAQRRSIERLRGKEKRAQSGQETVRPPNSGEGDGKDKQGKQGGEMRKLSKLKRHPSTQSLVLFDDVLDGEKLLQSPEIKKLIEYFYENYDLSIVHVENPERRQDYFREEQYRAGNNNRSMIYPVKAHFDDLTLDTHSEEFSAPLNVLIFTPPAAIFDVLTITCQWSDGLFRNDYYVVGAIVDTEDLEKMGEMKTQVYIEKQKQI